MSPPIAADRPARSLARLGKAPLSNDNAQSMTLATAIRVSEAIPPAAAPSLIPEQARLPDSCSRIPLPEGYCLDLLTGVESERQELLDHWKRLSQEDRRMRFFSFTPDDMLFARALKMDFSSPRLLVIRNAQGAIAACGEWAVDPETPEEAECAFSCDASERGQGLSKSLGLACFLDAAQFGISKARIETLRDNGAARALAKSLGARWVPDGPGFGVARAMVSAEANPALKSLWDSPPPQAQARATKPF